MYKELKWAKRECVNVDSIRPTRVQSSNNMLESSRAMELNMFFQRLQDPVESFGSTESQN